MRTLILAALLAGAAAPAIAAGPDDHRFGRSDDTRSERAERAKPDRGSDDRAEPASRVSDSAPMRADSGPAARADEPSMPSNLPSRDFGDRRAGADRSSGGGDAVFGAPSLEAARERPSRGAGDTVARWRTRHDQGGADVTVVETSDSPARAAEAASTTRRSAGDSVRDWRGGERRRGDGPTSIEARNMRTAPGISEASAGGLVQPSRSRPLPRVFNPDRRISRTPVFGTEPPRPATASSAQATPRHRWSSVWRHDRRYDWRNWRHRHRSLFRLGFYYDPFGWDYHRYSIGWRLWPSYYRSSFWLNDPWQYRLPPAYGPYRWIRYHGDALLVNIYTGEVVDVVYDFFW